MGGTASHVGKSWTATAICAYLRGRGVKVAPFKSQNMSNNSYPCAGGGEIGRAQVAQAWACGLEPEPAMNPVLLKPEGDSRSQVVVNGKVWKTLSAREYYTQVPELRVEARKAFDSLAARFDVIVMEGAGSVAELNLLENDFANLGFAAEVGARGILVSEIARGGVFGALCGTMEILPDELQAVVRSFLVNQFRGDLSLFDDGRKMLEYRLRRPCLGVMPFAPEIYLDAEDSVGLGGGGGDVAVVRLPRISNTTDFRLLREATWVGKPVDRVFKAVVLPGTKDTAGDLRWLRETGLAGWVLGQAAAGATVLGICGGLQMLGESVDGELGLGLLPGRTVMGPEKVTVAKRGRTPGGREFAGYEIHMGVTEGVEGEWVRRGNVLGTYWHGALEEAGVVEELLGVRVAPAGQRESEFVKLAQWFERGADMAVFERYHLG